MLVQKQKSNKIKFFLISSVILGLVFFVGHALAVEYSMDNLDSIETWRINQDINEKNAQIQDLNKQVKIYQKNIQAKQSEIANLSGQLSVLNDNIAKINLEIKSAQLEIETTNLKIENVELKIQAKEKEIADQKETVAEILRALHREQQQSSVLEVLVVNDNFSDFMAKLDNLEKMQDSVVSQVNDLKTVKMAMTQDQATLENNKTELDALQNILDSKKSDLDEQKLTKASIMKVTQGQESKFQDMLEQAKQEQQQINSDIVNLEKIAREKLNRQLQQTEAGQASPGLMWPLNSRVITTYFHDPDYPYRTILGEHPAIDVAAPQGTAIKAADSGYVSIAKNGGKTGYSYIMIVHANNLATVYGHINQIIVSPDQFVTKGQVIGYSGGMPGTNGAGSFSTGPHLHLEVRLNGVPVNPLNYLP